jgi:hypothetical protein
LKSRIFHIPHFARFYLNTMKTIRLALVSFAAAIGSLVSFAQQNQTEPFVAAISGSATVILPGATAAVPVVAGQKLPEGSTVTTAPGATVMIQSHEGIQTGLAEGSTVSVGAHTVSAEGVRTAVLDIKRGTTVSVLDPAKRAVNNYAVRTPKGVAAARGTVYATTVTVDGLGEVTVTVDTVTGSVSFAITGGDTVTVVAGNTASTANPNAISIKDAIAADTAGTKKAGLLAAVKVASFVAQVTADATNSSALTNALNTLAEGTLDSEIQAAVTSGQTAASQAASNGGVSTTPNSTSGADPQTITAPSPTETPQEPIDITIVSPT